MSREKWEDMVRFADNYPLYIFGGPIVYDPRGVEWASRRIEKLEKVREAAKETRDASAAICRLIFYNSPGLIEKLPSQYDGFGQRINAALRDAEVE